MSAGPQEKGLAEEIWPASAPEHAVPEHLPLAEFKSWHLPRKQWVRRVQWFTTTKRLLRKLVLNDRPLRYLGLPGSELLDLEVLAELCAEHQLRLKYLGFNTGLQSQSELTIQQLAENSLKTLAVVDSGSLMLTDDVFTLSSTNSVAAQRLKDFDSFDVINLDVCDAFTTRPGRAVHRAVRNLLEFQTNSRTHPWLLFITTVIDREAIVNEEVVAYRELLLHNCQRSERFRTLLSALLETNDARDEGVLVAAIEAAVGMLFGRFLTVGIGKWLLSVIGAAGWTVELKSSLCFRRGLLNIEPTIREVPQPELISMVFLLDRLPTRLADPTPITGPVHIANRQEDIAISEEKCAFQIGDRATHLYDLDVVMQKDEARRVQFVEECARMLALRNYDPEKYREWAAGVPLIPTA